MREPTRAEQGFQYPDLPSASAAPALLAERHDALRQGTLLLTMNNPYSFP